MSTSQIKEMPDIPEYHEIMKKLILDMRTALIPIMLGKDPNLCLNCMSTLLLSFATYRFETQEEIDKMIENLCHCFRVNSQNILTGENYGL